MTESFWKGRELRLIVFIFLCVLVLAFFVKRFSPDTLQEESLRGTPRDLPLGQRVGVGLPAGGYAQNPVGDTIPGDPDRGVADLQRLGRFIEVYRKRNGGAYPSSMLPLNSDYMSHPKEYGMTSNKETAKLFINPDGKYADDPTLRKDPMNCIAYIVQGKRPDGTPIGGPKKPGERDVLAITDMYFHRNIVNRNLPAKDTVDPKGVFVVLYDDGTVEKVPWQEVREVKQGNNDSPPFKYEFGYPGQAGVPENARTLGDRYKTTKP